jgi:deoxyhypusine monooxygenase
VTEGDSARKESASRIWRNHDVAKIDDRRRRSRNAAATSRRGTYARPSRFASARPSGPRLRVSTCGSSLGPLRPSRRTRARPRKPPPPPFATMSVASLRLELMDQSLGMPRRFRALFGLRSVGSDASVSALLDSLVDPSALFKHEVAFALGQMQAQAAVATLKTILVDEKEHGMVRHEAAEALGAIASDECLDALETACGDESQVVRETAVLALQRFRYAAAMRNGGVKSPKKAKEENQKTLGSAKEKLCSSVLGGTTNTTPAATTDTSHDSPYISVDPVPAASVHIPLDQLKLCLLDEAKPLWDRYAAMFALRNRGGAPEVAKVLAEVLVTSKSALLKHEVCYVLGQIQERGEGARAALTTVLENCNEHPMVRHEAAEAIGSIAAVHTKSLLEKYRSDTCQIVAESCEVALDMMEMEINDEFVPLVVEAQTASA